MTSLLTELKRRNVFRVAAAYVIVAWVVAQVIDLMADNFGAPDWFIKMVLALLVVGLPVALVLAWAYELTPDGVVKTEDVPPAASITPKTGRKLNVVMGIALLLALGFIAWDKLGPEGTAPAASGADKSVAVLPFADLSEKRDQEWFADGMTEEILNALARLPELRVTARTSSFEFKNTNTDISDIASQLGVAHVVEGSIRRIGSDLRVTAQLIRASDGFHLWSNTYDSTTENLFEVQQQVAENIAATLDVILDDEKRDRMFRSGTRNVAAFEAFLKGRDLYYKAHERNAQDTDGTIISLADANVFFDEALRIDPSFAAPAIMRSDRFAHRLLEFDADIVGNGEEMTAEFAYDQLRKNLQLAADNAKEPIERVIAEINQVLFGPRWDRLPRLFEELNALAAGGAALPSDNLWLQETLRIFDQHALAQKFLDINKAADPLNQSRYSDELDLALSSGQYDKLGGMIEEVRRRFGTSVSMYDVQLNMYLVEGDKQSAIELLRDGPPPQSGFDWFDPMLPALEGNTELALQMIASVDGPDSWPNAQILAIYSAMGDRERYQDLASRIDKLPAGHTILALELANNGRVLWMDLERTPNLRKRLEEAKVDVSTYIPGVWPPQTESKR